MADKTVMDEVNAALGDALSGEDPPAPVETPDPETPDDAAEGVESDSDGADEGEGGEGGEPEGAEETDAEAEARGAERDPLTGKFKKKAEEEKPAEGEKPKAAESKKADPVNDPIPKDLKKDTQERIRTLIDTTKAVTAERDEIKQNFDFMVNGIQQTGATPQQYGETLSWLALFNSQDPKQQEKALELVETVAERLATLLGRERTVGDPLGQHADLKEAVASGKLNLQFAKEIARTRNGQTFRSEINANASQENQRQQQAAEEERQGRAALTELEATLQATDPDYARKKAILVPALKPIMVTVPWGQKKDKFLAAYKAVQLPAAPKPKVNGTPVNQPLRAGKQPAGGQTKQPSSMLEAISGALGSMHK
jgi:hypothetical protein